MISSTKLTASSQWSGHFKPGFGVFSLSISGTWAGTISVQRSLDGGATWNTVQQFTANTEQVAQQSGLASGLFQESPNAPVYRVGVDASVSWSGAAVVILAQ